MVRILANSPNIMTLKQQQSHQREPTAVAERRTSPDEECLNRNKVEPSKVAQGMATLEQEQQLWRPGVKAEQVFTYDFSFMINCISHFQ